MPVEAVFTEIAVLLIFSAALALGGLILRQPLIVSFIAAGILAGPSALGLMDAHDQLHLLAEMGIALLLFVVGLKLDLHLIRTMGTVAAITGLGQVIFTSVIGYFICVGLGFSVVESLYIAIALTFSSTIIIVKLLSDKGEIDALHGRVALGFLIVQDIVVVLVMIVLSAMGAGGDAEASLFLTIALVVAKGALLLAAVALFIRFAANPLLNRLAKSPELLILFAVGFAIAFAAGSELLGFSNELGAFLAGVALASTPYRETIGARLTALRDFLLLFFFLSLGAGLDLALLGEQVAPAILLSAFVLIGNPLIVMLLMGVMGYRARTGFLAGLTVAQISEFSLIFAALGLALGHIGNEVMGLVTLVGLITIGLSTYMILYSQQIFGRIGRFLGIFERRTPYREQQIEAKAAEEKPEEYDAIVFGMGRFGSNIARGLRQCGLSVLGVDFDPQSVARARQQGHPAVYGDANDPAFPKSLPLRDHQWVINATPPNINDLTGADTTMTLLKALRESGYGGKIAVTTHRAADAARYRDAGANLVMIPFADAARRAVEAIREIESGAPHSVVEDVILLADDLPRHPG